MEGPSPLGRVRSRHYASRSLPWIALCEQPREPGKNQVCAAKCWAASLIGGQQAGTAVDPFWCQQVEQTPDWSDSFPALMLYRHLPKLKCGFREALQTPTAENKSLHIFV